MHKEAFIKMAIKLKGLHGTHGNFKKLIPWYGGPNMGALEANKKAVYAGTNRRALKGHIENYAKQTAAKRGGTPTVLKLTMDTKKGWEPSGFSRSAHKTYMDEFGHPPENEGALKEFYRDLIEEGDDLQKAIKSAKGADKAKLKQELGSIYKILHKDVGGWAGPETKTYSPKVVKD